MHARPVCQVYALADVVGKCAASRLQREWAWEQRLAFFKEDEALRCARPASAGHTHVRMCAKLRCVFWCVFWGARGMARAAQRGRALAGPGLQWWVRSGHLDSRV